MKRTCKLAAAALLTAAVTVGTVTACAAAETAVTTETYAYLPDHSVYFYDVDDGYSWAFREVDTLAVAGVIQGRGDHLFYPRNAITRADFIVMLDRAYGMSSALASGAVTAQQDFSDVPSDKYYAKSVAAARALGVATGTADNRFLPQQTMSRQDAMVFLKRTIDRTELTLRDGAITGFSDAAEVKSYAQEAVGALTSAKVIGGTNGKLNPNAPVTRAEMAVMLYRALHLTENGGSGGAVYHERKDTVNLCIGAQSYSDVVIENYDPSVTYEGLVQYSGLHQDGSTMYVSIDGAHAIDRTAEYKNDTFTFDTDTENDGITGDYPAAADCVAIDAGEPYHQIAEPVSTGSEYRTCYPSIRDGEVVAVYYVK